MEKLRMPASYATLPEEELPEIFGGGELGDALYCFRQETTACSSRQFNSLLVGA